MNEINMFFVRSNLAGRLKTAVPFQNDPVFLFLKNYIKDEVLSSISQMNESDRQTSWVRLRDKLLKLYHSKPDYLLKKMNIANEGHMWGPWEFLD